MDEQVKLTLTKNADVLNALRRRGTLVKARDGSEVYEILHDSRPLSFRIYSNGERNIIPVPANVAEILRANSRTIIGDPLSGHFVPALVEVGRYSLSEGDPALRFTKTTCPFCRVETGDPRSLAKHLMVECQSPEAKVPGVIARLEREAREQEAAEQERRHGPSQAVIDETLSVERGTLREIPDSELVPATEGDTE